MSVMQSRMLTKQAMARDEDDTDELIDTIAEVVAEMFDELLTESMKRPEFRTAILNMVTGNNRAPATGRATVRAAAVKAARRR